MHVRLKTCKSLFKPNSTLIATFTAWLSSAVPSFWQTVRRSDANAGKFKLPTVYQGHFHRTGLPDYIRRPHSLCLIWLRRSIDNLRQLRRCTRSRRLSTPASVAWHRLHVIMIITHSQRPNHVCSEPCEWPLEAAVPLRPLHTPPPFALHLKCQTHNTPISRNQIRFI